MSSHYEAPIRKPLILGDKSYHDVSNDIARPVETPPDKDWWIAFSIAMAAQLGPLTKQEAFVDEDNPIMIPTNIVMNNFTRSADAMSTINVFWGV